MNALLLVVALILFVLRAFGVGGGGAVDLGWLGLAFLAGSFLFSAIYPPPVTGARVVR